MRSHVCVECGIRFQHKDIRKFCSWRCYFEYRIKKSVEMRTFICAICGCEFVSKKRMDRVFCSRKCQGLSWVGIPKSAESIQKMKARLREIGKSHDTETYIDKNGFEIVTGTPIKVHTLVAEKVLGRKMKYNEVVHHIDGDRSNNRNSNLVICERSLHPIIHTKIRKQMEVAA